MTRPLGSLLVPKYTARSFGRGRGDMSTRVEVAEPPAAITTTDEAERRSALRDRSALLVFAVYVGVSFIVLLRMGRHYWFYEDEWHLLLRDLTPAGLFRPLNQHWLTLPLLVFHALFWAFGLNYGPYQVCAITLHLTLVVLLRWIMRRAGVGPWLSTIVAGTFVLYGPGYQNILQAVQISLVGSAVLGVCHLLLADHDGPLTRRDALGLLCGALGLMASGLGTVMVVVVGIAVFIRRGWRIALVHTAPLVVLNALWFAIERKSTKVPGHAVKPLAYAVQWNIDGERAAFRALGAGYTLIALAIFATLAGGLFIAWRPRPLAELRQREAIPAALLLAGPVMFTLVSSERYWLKYEVDSSKFVYLATAFALPGIAIGASAIARRWRLMAPVVILLLLVGLVANIGKFPSDSTFQPGFFATEKAVLLGAAYSPLAARAPRDLQPMTQLYTAPDVTLGFLLDARKAGRLPPPPRLTPVQSDVIAIRLGVEQLQGPLPRPAPTCHAYYKPLLLRPAAGTVYMIDDWVSVRSGRGAVGFDPSAGRVLKVLVPNLEIEVNNIWESPGLAFHFCE